MADIVAFVQNILHYATSAGNAVFTFNYRMVSAVIRIVGESYAGTKTVFHSLGTALLDIFLYIVEFLAEAVNVVKAFFALVLKFLLLVYHILSSLCVGVVFLLEKIGAGISFSIIWLGESLPAVWDYLTWLCGSTGTELQFVATKIHEVITAALGSSADYIQLTFSSVAKNSVESLNSASESLSDAIVYTFNFSSNATSQLSHSTAGLLSTAGITVCALCSTFGEFIALPFVYTWAGVQKCTCVVADWVSGIWSQVINSIPVQVYLYILGTTLTIIIFKKIMDHLHKQGMTFPMFDLTPSSRSQIGGSHRRRFTIDSSDEESMSEEDNIELEFHGQTVLGNEAIPLFDVHGNDFGDNSDTDEGSDDEDEGSDASDDEEEDGEEDGVEEYEVISDTDTDEGSEAQINIELPERGGHYNLRTRASPVPTDLLSPSDLGRVLESERDKRLCVVCQDQLKNVLVLPCRHMCLCVDCAHELAVQRNHTRRVCPLCRTRIETVMDVYV